MKIPYRILSSRSLILMISYKSPFIIKHNDKRFFNTNAKNDQWLFIELCRILTCVSGPATATSEANILVAGSIMRGWGRGADLWGAVYNLIQEQLGKMQILAILNMQLLIYISAQHLKHVPTCIKQQRESLCCVVINMDHSVIHGTLFVNGFLFIWFQQRIF